MEPTGGSDERKRKGPSLTKIILGGALVSTGLPLAFSPMALGGTPELHRFMLEYGGIFMGGGILMGGCGYLLLKSLSRSGYEDDSII